MSSNDFDNKKNNDYVLVSDYGQQIIISIILILIMGMLSFQVVRNILWYIIGALIRYILKVTNIFMLFGF